MRLKEVGYSIEPVYKMNPFSGCRSSFAVMMAKNSKNINCAKLFIRFLLGESDGKGEGMKPFNQPGTWSVRDDVADGTAQSLDDIDLIIPDTDAIIRQKKDIEDFWTRILKESTMATE